MFSLSKFFSAFKSRNRVDAAPARQALPEQAEWLIVGLGNPGPRYATTRHNVGFLAADVLVSDFEGVPGLKAVLGVDGDAVVVKPTTFMNLSGEAVAPVAERFNVLVERIIVIHDELDLPEGTVRVKQGGNENGHNGLKSLTEHLGSRDYLRVRVGIGRPPAGTSIPDWVLARTDGDFSDALDTAAEAARLIVSDGLSVAQNRIHSRGK